MNKCVIGNSDVIRPRLLQLLDRNRWWSEKDSNVCVDLCGLINSIVRDCSALSENILTRSDILVQLINVILHSDTDALLQESCLLLLRSLFGAEELSSVLSQTTQIRSRHAAALRLFTNNVIRRLITLCWPGLQSPTISSSAQRLTGKSRCYLMQLLSLLATDRQLVGCLRRCDAVRLCHHVILTAVCDHPKTCTLGLTPTGGKTPVNRVACVRAIDPANQLAARFALKLLVHLFFHVPDALEAFSEVFPEDQHPSKLLYCYGQLAGSVPPNVPGVSHQVPSGHRIKRMRKFVTTTSQDDQKASLASFTSKSSAGYSNCSPEHVRIPVSSCAPSAHGTQVCLGLLRGLIYWRLLNQPSSQSVDAIDQFGNPVTSAPGLGLSDDDVALLVIQPLTDACLHTDDIRILSWICHVLVLVLGRRPELHQWTVYANSFIREVDVRVTSLIKAVQAASNCHSHVQFVEHLIPLVKLFACLASSCENIRVLFGEVYMCEKLFEFTLRLKPMGSEHGTLMLEFQHSVAVLLHVLSRSFSAHHSFFRQESSITYLIQLVEDNLSAACRGQSLCAHVVEAASCALVNILLPMSPGRQISQSIVERCISVFIRLINAKEQQDVSASSASSETVDCSLPELTPDLRSCNTLLSDRLQHTLTVFRLNGVWGLANILHSAPSSLCSELFERLVTDGAWLELVRPIQSARACWSGSSTAAAVFGSCGSSSTRRVSYDFSSGVGNPHSSGTGQNVNVPGTLRASPFSEPSLLSHKDGPDISSLITADSVKSNVVISKSADNTQETTTKARSSLIESIPKGEESHVTIQTMLLFYTLMLLRNLLRHRKVIDAIIKEHWWDVTQLIISVLEGNNPKPMKEQAILVLAHIANGQTALEQLHRNEDLIEKLKLFMRSPDSHIKAAALTATFNLLGLGREGCASPMFLSNLRDPGNSLLHSCHRGLLHRHHRHKDRHRRRPESHMPPNVSTSPPESTIRSVVTCVAQSTLEEAEEELEEEEQDVVLEHAYITEEASSHAPLMQDSEPARPLERLDAGPPTGWVLQDSTVSFTPTSDTSQETPDSAISRRHRRVYRCWLSPPSVSATEGDSENLVTHSESALPRSLSGSSSSSSTSSTSCAEELMHSGTQLADLDPTTAQDVCGASSSCSEGELRGMDPCVHEEEAGEAATHLTGSRAPLAAQEGLDEVDTQITQLSASVVDGFRRTPETSYTHSNLTDTSRGNAICDSSTSIPESSKVDETSPVLVKSSPPSGSKRSSVRRSRRDWEAGFRHVLLPFLQELESDQILRGTWDWLMLRASTMGRPIPLHQLLVAWQRLHDTIPSSSLLKTTTTSLDFDASLFTNCVTVDAFLKKLKQSSTSSVSPFLNSPRHREGRHHPRRRHHHCHRHQLRTQSRRLADQLTEHPSSEDTCISTPVPPTTTTSEDFERTDDASAS
ncbi:hypothetical protein CRM22_009079 [Opisthorchis felineus]|uniref:Armadillo repeat-containing domain-containing protein n=1 Tax=Opisthorchis felineus TaxID=147828 RepID=A0A4S2L914_OPIFE|nr:hypothetical protein CRM22_009079 [Opisthorchis felineus]